MDEMKDLMSFEAACTAAGGAIYDAGFLYGKKEAENVLLISHELSLTGAPIALGQFAVEIRAMGKTPIVLSPVDGPLREELLKKSISVAVVPASHCTEVVEQTALFFEAIIVCTLVNSKYIAALNGMKVSVLWWIHETKALYNAVELQTVPMWLFPNITVAAGGPLAKAHLLQFRPNYEVTELLYGLQDVSVERKRRNLLPDMAQGKTVFALVGSIESRKGQDILLSAIGQLPEKILQQCYFIFVGTVLSVDIFDQLQQAIKDLPDRILYIPQFSRDDLADFYDEIDCEIIASRDDPMPVTATEVLRAGKLLICSEHTGTAALIRKHNAGLIYYNDSSDELKERIIDVVMEQPQQYETLCQNGRMVYESYFSESVFSANVKILMDTMKKEKPLNCKAAIRQLEKGWREDSLKVLQYAEEVQHIKAALAQSQAEYSSISNSTCWKITKPFRAILDNLKKLLRNCGFKK